MTGYTLQITDHGFVLDFSIQQLEKFANQKLQVSYQMKVMNAEPDTEIVNEGQLLTDKHTINKKLTYGLVGNGSSKEIVKIRSEHWQMPYSS